MSSSSKCQLLVLKCLRPEAVKSVEQKIHCLLCQPQSTHFHYRCLLLFYIHSGKINCCFYLNCETSPSSFFWGYLISCTAADKGCVCLCAFFFFFTETTIISCPADIQPSLTFTCPMSHQFYFLDLFFFLCGNC